MEHKRNDALLDELGMACWHAMVPGPRPFRTEREYRAGDVAFEKFFAETLPIWRANACQIMRRWKSPAQHDDVLQEMRVRLWQKFLRYDPAKGKIGKYLVWGARVAGKRCVHAERGANKHGTRDKNPSRYAIPFSAFERDDGSMPARFDVSEEATQERVVEVRMIVARCRTAVDRLIVEALIETGGYVDIVARRIYGDDLDLKIARDLVQLSLRDLGCRVADFESRAA